MNKLIHITGEELTWAELKEKLRSNIVDGFLSDALIEHCTITDIPIIESLVFYDKDEDIYYLGDLKLKDSVKIQFCTLEAGDYYMNPADAQYSAPVMPYVEEIDPTPFKGKLDAIEKHLDKIDLDALPSAEEQLKDV